MRIVCFDLLIAHEYICIQVPTCVRVRVYTLVLYSQCVGGWVYDFFSDARKSEFNSSSCRHAALITNTNLLLLIIIIAASAIELALSKCLWYRSSKTF